MSPQQLCTPCPAHLRCPPQPSLPPVTLLPLPLCPQTTPPPAVSSGPCCRSVSSPQHPAEPGLSVPFSHCLLPLPSQHCWGPHPMVWSASDFSCSLLDSSQHSDAPHAAEVNRYGWIPVSPTKPRACSLEKQLTEKCRRGHHLGVPQSCGVEPGWCPSLPPIGSFLSTSQVPDALSPAATPWRPPQTDLSSIPASLSLSCFLQSTSKQIRKSKSLSQACLGKSKLSQHFSGCDFVYGADS